MAQTKTEIQQLLQSIGMEGPRKRFGQNFMIDRNLIAKIVEAGEINPADQVIEIGPGTGTLTEELIATGASVLAVEIDRDLAGLLRERFANRPNFRLILGDALAGKHELNTELRSTLRPGTKLVANLPYNIASPLIIEMLIAGVELLAFTVQKEVAQRLVAKADSEHYGPLSVMTQLLGEPEILRILPPQVFWPAPKVESALVRIHRNDHLGSSAGEFSAFVHSLFGARRKMLRKALSIWGLQSTEGLDFDLEKRVEVYSPMDLLGLWLGIKNQETQ
ncbi:MAG TPA: 16S rRNA (adenine(1518)-N(6)/adenine(1519)-N(6))-dimethyltransferase RsmA [Tepidisphaeraceae bacterium]|jgi:16S rRNA (adenine1518-N6/adenine1519-N6)-dimethyltransferase